MSASTSGITTLKGDTVSVGAFACDFEGACVQFSGEVLYDGATRYGHVFLSANGANFSSFLFVECSGPAYQNFGTLNQGTGAATVSVTLDPSALDCQGFSSTGTPPIIVVNLAGHADGQSHDSTSGVTTVQSALFGSSKRNTQSDCYSEVFNGAIAPFSPESFGGNACATRYIDRR